MEEKMDLRIRKTYLSLHNAFTALLEEKRFDEITVNELCDRAMIRRTTFYKHFADKYEYFTFYLKETVQTFQDQLAPDVESHEVNAYLLHMSRELVRFLRSHNKLVINVRESSMFPVLLSILLDEISADSIQVLQRADRENEMNKEKRECLAAFYAGGMLNTLFQLHKKNPEIDEELFIEVASQYFWGK